MSAIAIAGAGLLGRLLASRLPDAGCTVTLFDAGPKDGKHSCSWVAGGMLTPWAELEKAEPGIAELGRRSLELWPKLLADLGRPVFFQQNGSLVVAHRQDSGDLAAFIAKVKARLPHTDLMKELDATALAAIEPQLSGRFARAVFFPDEAQLEPRDVMPALAHALDAKGVDWRPEHNVSQIAPGIIVANQQTYHFDLVIDCRGLGARDEHAGLRGVRGEVIRVYAPEVRLQRPIRLMHPRYPIYIVPRPDDVYLIGATSIESEDMGGITVRSALELLSAAYSLHSGFAEARLLETKVHCRPAFRDNNPHIQAQPGLIRANGLYRHGFLIAPAFVEQIMETVGSCTIWEADRVTHSR